YPGNAEEEPGRTEPLFNSTLARVSSSFRSSVLAITTVPSRSWSTGRLELEPRRTHFQSSGSLGFDDLWRNWSSEAKMVSSSMWSDVFAFAPMLTWGWSEGMNPASVTFTE